MELMQWLAPYRALFAVLLVGCSVINNQLYIRHVGRGMTKRDRFGYFRYFWQLSLAGNRDGRLAMFLLFVVVASGGILIGTLFV